MEIVSIKHITKNKISFHHIGFKYKFLRCFHCLALDKFPHLIIICRELKKGSVSQLHYNNLLWSLHVDGLVDCLTFLSVKATVSL